MRRVAVLLLATACADPEVAECSFLCELDGDCPLGLACGEDGFCHSDPTERCEAACVGCALGGPYNIAFVTSTTYIPGELGGLEGADAECNERAQDAGLPGEYRAWLSTSTASAVSRMTTPTGAQASGWVRTDGRPFARSLGDLLGGAILYPLGLDESGAGAGSPWVATGTASDGSVEMPIMTANDWTAIGPYWAGEPFATTDWWVSQKFGPEDQPAHLYCFGVDHDRPIEIPPFPGRRAFLSRQEFSPSSLAAADELCAGEAAEAGLSGARALLSTQAASAAARFDLDGPTWVRLDGIPWLESAADLASGSVMAALNLQSDGLFANPNQYVWTGAGSPDSTLGASCEDWTSAAAEAIVGQAIYAGSNFFNSQRFPCDPPRRLYCLEE